MNFKSKKDPVILAIDTSLDETSVAVTRGRRILTNVVFSQVKYHQKYKGVMPSLAKRLHQEKLPLVIKKALKNTSLSESEIDLFAVTQGPGQALALEVGIKTVKELALKHKKPLVAVNHMVGHIYSAFCQNSKGNPGRDFDFPYLVLIISGGHTQLLLFKDHLEFELLGETLDDAVGEALDKAARMLGFGYPGGPIIERLSKKGDGDKYQLPVPLIHKGGLDFSYSGLKTALLYKIREMGKLSGQEIYDLSASFQSTVIKSFLFKIKRALKEHQGIESLIVVGGVSSNEVIRRSLKKEFSDKKLFFPSLKGVFTDNAAMIGVAAYYYYLAKRVADLNNLDRLPNMSF